MFKSERTRIVWSIVIKSLLLVIGITGLIFTLTADSFMGSLRGFLFFTIQSNVTIIVITGVFLITEIVKTAAGKEIINNRLLIIKFIFTVAITVTFLIFFAVLAPTQTMQYLMAYENFAVHLFVPLLAITDFLLFDYRINLSGTKPLWGLAMPLYYLTFSLIGSAAGMDFNGEIVPYFFLNYKELGWLWERDTMGVIFWIIIFAAMIMCLSFLIALFVKLINRSMQKKMTVE